IVTTARVAPPIEVCLQGVGFTAQDRVLHYEADAWLDVTTSSTPTKVCATVASLSPFAVITIANHAPTADAGAPQTVEATSAADVADGVVATTCAPASGSTFPSGATTVTCTATDSHANHATKTFTVTVTDTTAPVITVPANATVEATGPTGVTFTYAASATDTLDGPITPTCAPASGSTFPFGATTVTCTAADSHANVATKT